MPPRRTGQAISRVEYGRLKAAWHQAREQRMAARKNLHIPSFSVKPSFGMRPSWAPSRKSRSMGSVKRKWMAERQERLDNRRKFQFGGNVRPSWESRESPYSWKALRERFGIRGTRPEIARAIKRGDVVGPESRRRRAFEMLGAGVGV